MCDQDWKVLIRSVEEDPPHTLEQRAIAIAEELRKGKPSVLFCQMLADMIYPSQKHNSTEYVLALNEANKAVRRDLTGQSASRWNTSYTAKASP